MENWHFSQVFSYFLFLQIFLSDPEKPKTTLKSLSIIFLNFLTNPAKETVIFPATPPDQNLQGTGPSRTRDQSSAARRS